MDASFRTVKTKSSGVRRRSSKSRKSTDILASRLLPELFSGYNENDVVTVLDLGGGSPQTVAFLNQFRARIIFVDLLDSPELTQLEYDDDTPEQDVFEQVTTLWQENLMLRDGLHIDICLFWNFLHYLEPLALEGLSAAIQPHVTYRTRAYGFGSLHGESDLPGQIFHIEDGEHLKIVPADFPAPPYAHSQQKLHEHLPCFKVARATLLQEGRLELLFEAY